MLKIAHCSFFHGAFVWLNFCYAFVPNKWYLNEFNPDTLTGLTMTLS